MNNIQKRFFLFLIGCMGTRIGFAYLAKEIDKEYFTVYGLSGSYTCHWFYVHFFNRK